MVQLRTWNGAQMITEEPGETKRGDQGHDATTERRGKKGLHNILSEALKCNSLLANWQFAALAPDFLRSMAAHPSLIG